MPTSFERNLHLCFTKLKRLQSPPAPPSQPPSHRRRHSKSNLFKTFNTLYDLPPPSTSDSDDTSTSAAAVATISAADLSTAIKSNRFFFSSPGRSNSIIESSSPSTSSLASTSFTPDDGGDGFAGGGVAIPTISPDPYFDFRKSMQEMVEARDINDARANWDYLHELLTCYLDLNPKSAHKFIVGAFADLLVTLMADNVACRNI
ncbi:transcription repressor OFP16-like [Rutidosis leptorrhynchoides]|uniref:transcription repressor OFP16-like n=1 Tax=Rutidosis leptorrhynchoides TaxID=125765 RepID=UPI003A99E835